MSDVALLIDRARTALAESGQACTSCGMCTERCELLAGLDWDLRAFCEESLVALDRLEEADGKGTVPLPNVAANTYQFVRTCLGCDRCTSRCPEGLSMSVLRAAWRNILRAGGYIDDSEVAGLFVDSTWDIFSVFRAVQGIAYDDLPKLEVEPIDAEWTVAGNRPKAETLFFPGCTLCSYSPELTRAAFAWLEEHEGPCLLATQCCASTLEGIGEGARATAWKRRVIQAARAQGVKRIVTVCPGCELRLAPAAADNAPEIEFVSFARLLVDAGVRVQAEALKGCALPVSVVDSCQDRAGAHGPAIRQLFQDADTVPFPATGKDAWCCGASGSVNSIDPRFVRECTRHQMARGAQAGARTLITACPTCAYTYAFERWTRAAEGSADEEGVGSLNYLEAVFGTRIDWPATFRALENMWNGEHSAWTLAKLFPH